MNASLLKKLPKGALCANLALSMLLTPALALADSNTIQLKPIQNMDEYNNAYVNPSPYGSPAASNLGYSNGYTNTPYNSNSTTANNPNPGVGLNNYENTSYYAPLSGPATLQGRLTSIPKGTTLGVHLAQSINTSGAHMGDPVVAVLENDLYMNDAVAIPAGSQVLGQVVNVNGAGHMGKSGFIDLRFDSVKLPDGHTIPIQAHVVTQNDSGVLRGDSYGMTVAKGVGIAAGSTGVGTLMGTAVGGLLGTVGTGALFGLGVGAVGGMGYALARKGKEVVIPVGARMSLILDGPVTVNN